MVTYLDILRSLSFHRFMNVFFAPKCCVKRLFLKCYDLNAIIHSKLNDLYISASVAGFRSQMELSSPQSWVVSTALSQFFDILLNLVTIKIAKLTNNVAARGKIAEQAEISFVAT